MADPPAEGLSFLLPVHNQAGALEVALSSWSSLLERLERPCEIIVIDDGSTDGTAKLLHGADGRPGLAVRLPHTRVLSMPARRGVGACLRAGIEAATQPLVFYTGLDYPYNPADLRTLLARLNEADPESQRKIDLINGYRAGTPLTGWDRWRDRMWRGLLRVVLGMESSPRPGRLGAAAHRYARKIRVLFGPRVGDIDSKFKLFRKSIFARIPIQSDGDFVHAEILAKANFLGCLMDEVPIAARPGPFPAHPEPPSPTPRGKELRRVFVNSDFGPALLPTRPPLAEPPVVAVTSAG